MEEYQKCFSDDRITEITVFSQEKSVSFVRKGKKKKSEVVPVLNLIKHYAMKPYGGVDVCINPHFLDLGTN
jgi:hypothetical protein